jgi:2,5-diketo-D-gluconate reductase A
MTNIPILRLNDGHAIPALGLGTVHMDDACAANVIPTAIDLGYRLIDTASRYGNENGIGEGIRNTRVPRDQLLLTSKVRGRDQGFDATLRAFDESVLRLGTDYLDLYLIHWPLPMLDKYVDTWKALVALQKDGRVRSIGVSNFLPHHIDRLVAETGVVPAVNQVQVDPQRTRPTIREYDHNKGILTESWRPLAGCEANSSHDSPIVTKIAESHNKTNAQVLLRWHVQLGLVPIPKTADSQRLSENIDVFDFSLTTSDMNALTTLDRGDEGADDANTYYED